MSDQPTLVPPEIEARTRSYKRVGVAFGDRLFMLLFVGLAWLGPAFFDSRFVYAMLAWDGLVLLAWVVDLAQMPRAEQLSVKRSWRSAAALSIESDIDLTLENTSRSGISATLIDTVPLELRSEPPTVTVRAAGRSEGAASYRIRPMQRGDAKIGDCYVRYQSVLRIAEKWVRAPLEQTVRIYPDLEEAKRHSLYLLRSRQIALEKRHTRMRGIGREFESLREYQPGDEYRDICWTAAARRAKLVTRVYQMERSQTVWIVIDCGRLMRARVGEFSKLDQAVNAALSLAQVALYSGDRVGLIAYGRAIRQQLPAAKGSLHLRQMIERLALVHEEGAEADHLHMASRLLTDQKRRSLIVWLTDLAETAMTPEVVEAASMMMPRHLVLFVVIGQPDLGALASKTPTSASEMYRIAAAQEMVHRRELLLARLRERGALAMEVSSGAVSPALVNAYLQIKERSQL
ncbi:MAG TPA: DUF58 domain-containing protein [Candidatus Dormibacteraeota bacterium]|nr:DUF58 domain-containing protein [Candidatus Dormibacteraeota bacterium]